MRDIVIYFTYGLTDDESLLKLLDGLYKIGVYAVELGIPFSDPVADGPTIQQASTAALKKGASLTKTINFLHKNRDRIKNYHLSYGLYQQFL